MKKNIYLLLIFLSLGNSSEFELFGASTLKPFYGFNNSQIISNSLGNATVAAGFLTPGLSSNPANFAANKLSTLHLNYSNNEFDGSSTISNSNFNGFDVVGHVIPLKAIPAGNRAYQLAVFIGQTYGSAIIF